MAEIHAGPGIQHDGDTFSVRLSTDKGQRLQVRDGALFVPSIWVDCSDFGTPTDATTRAEAVQGAIQFAATHQRKTVYVPGEFLNYDAAKVHFDPNVALVREGQVSDMLDGWAYGMANTGQEAHASYNVAALNAMFGLVREFAAPNRENKRFLPIHIPAGDYYVNATIWAGFSGGSAKRYWQLYAVNATLIATEELAGRVVFDMTGVFRGDPSTPAIVSGLSITTKAGITIDQCPRIGLLYSRTEGVRKLTYQAGHAFFEHIDVHGHFQLTAFYGMASEVNTFVHCRFANQSAKGPWAFICSDRSDYYEGVKSEFAPVPADGQSNTNHQFYSCHFRCAWQGDPMEGGLAHFMGFVSVNIFGSFFIAPHEHMRGPAIRLSTRDHGMNPSQQFTAKGIQCDGPRWYQIIAIDGKMENVRIEDVYASYHKALLTLSPRKDGAPCVVKGLKLDYVRQEPTKAIEIDEKYFTVDTEKGAIRSKGHLFRDRDEVKFTHLHGHAHPTAPGGVEMYKTYWVVNTEGDTFQLSATKGGEPIKLTSAGNGAIIMQAWKIYAIDGTSKGCEVTHANITHEGLASQVLEIGTNGGDFKGKIRGGPQVVLPDHAQAIIERLSSVTYQNVEVKTQPKPTLQEA